MTKPGRNDPCPCGSGRKYKKCCLNKAAPVSLNWRKMRKTEGELVPLLLEYVGEAYGPEAFAEAWDEFTLWDDVPMDAEDYPELDTIFLPWFLFNWIPDNADRDDGHKYPEMEVAIDYLEQCRAKIDSFQGRFIEACCSESYSFFVVTAVEPGKSLSLRDLFLQREVTVQERQASSTVHKGDILFTRIADMDDCAIMVGCAPTVIPPTYINQFIDMRERLEGEMGEVCDLDFLVDYDDQLRDIYFNIRKQIHNPAPPTLQNTDGDPLQPTKIHYRLTCTPREALEALIGLSLGEVDEPIDAGEFDGRGELRAIEIPWIVEGNKLHKSWDNTVMGYLRIDADQLIIDVNSQWRAEAIKREVERRLGKRAVYRHAVIESIEKAMEAARGRSAGPRPGQSPDDRSNSPEVQQAIKEMAERHWREWLDTPIPALKGQTPRDAARSEQGRERLEALLMQYDRPDRAPEPFDPDFDALRRELGLS